ncbi:uncharacterized protein LOC116193772 [Punica granatum]|uniref:Uncharacterized protein LOC116193772 n=1 Tax=Punica granatum TaxID=22663 RepID=A0A6P8CBB4_PUNGR|nr:uncharacterized protein LOC116193772 [Punica granatum]
MMRKEDNAEDSGKGVQTSTIFKIGASDSTGLQITSCLLNGDNYLTWSRAMRIALTAKGKLGFVEGRVPKPPAGDPNLESWEMCNSLVLAWIFNGLEKELQPSATYATEAKTLWDDLKERYSQGNEMRIYQLKSDISIYRQEGKTIQKYYSGIKTLWDELENYLESLGCSCDAAARYTAQREKEKIYQFLMGLDEQFRGVRSDILRAEPLPSMSRIYQMVSEEEKQHTVARSREVARMPEGGAELGAFAARTGSENRQGQRWTTEGRPICDHCGRAGHVKSSCWVLHGQPADGNNRGKGKKLGGQGKQITGQWKGSGQWNGGKMAMANAAQEAVVPSGSSGQTKQFSGGSSGQNRQFSGLSNAVHEGRVSNSAGNILSGLSNTQYETLLSIIAAHEGRSEPLVGNIDFISVENTNWIIDTGASRHMTGCVDCLDDLRSIDDKIPIYIPNGNSTRATNIGPHIEEIVGLGELRRGVYYLRWVASSTLACQALRIGSGDIWHKRLGHPSSGIRIKEIDFDSSCMRNKNCDSGIMVISVERQIGGKGKFDGFLISSFEMGLYIRRPASLPTRFWGESVATAAYLINMMLTPVLGGYPHGKRGWQMFDLEKEDFFVSRDVRFCESEFPFEKIGRPTMSTGNPLFIDQMWNEENIKAEGESDEVRDGGGHTRRNWTELSFGDKEGARDRMSSPRINEQSGPVKEMEDGSPLNGPTEARVMQPSLWPNKPWDILDTMDLPSPG